MQEFLKEQSRLVKKMEASVKKIKQPPKLASTEEVKDAEEFQEWKKTRKADIDSSIKALHESIHEQAAHSFGSIEKQFDYPVFMAIAESIGYDATGRETSENDLPMIAEQLTEFLLSVKSGSDAFFV
jgi:hypothetical protein